MHPARSRFRKKCFVYFFEFFDFRAKIFSLKYGLQRRKIPFAVGRQQKNSLPFWKIPPYFPIFPSFSIKTHSYRLHLQVCRLLLLVYFYLKPKNLIQAKANQNQKTKPYQATKGLKGTKDRFVSWKERPGNPIHYSIIPQNPSTWILGICHLDSDQD